MGKRAQDGKTRIGHRRAIQLRFNNIGSEFLELRQFRISEFAATSTVLKINPSEGWLDGHQFGPLALRHRLDLIHERTIVADGVAAALPGLVPNHTPIELCEPWATRP